MSELIDLTKILKVGDEVYNIVLGSTSKVKSFEDQCIILPGVAVTIFGQYTNNGECVIFPSKTQRDWSKHVKDPLFITEDGAAVYGEETVWLVSRTRTTPDNMCSVLSKLCNPKGNPDIKYFLTLTAAEDYILKNKKSPFTAEQIEKIIEIIRIHK